jgi:hypothetical protein
MFKGDQFFLSNFYPVSINYDGDVYPSVENAFQAAKTAKENRAPFLTCHPSIAKKLGRKVKLRKDWEKSKKDLLLYLLKVKFMHPELRKRLLSTGNTILVEENTWHDNFWGKCICPLCDSVSHLNVLGDLLMQVRESMKQLQVKTQGSKKPTYYYIKGDTESITVKGD